MAKGIETRTSKKSVSGAANTPAPSNGHVAGGRAIPSKATGASIDELAQRLSQVEGVSRDSAEFLAHNWQRFVGGLFVLLLVVVLVYQYRGATRARAGEASQRFESATQQFSKLYPMASDPEAKDPLPTDPDAATTDTALSEQLKGLQTSHNDTIYGQLAKLYTAQVDINKKNVDAAETVLDQLPGSKLAPALAARTSKDAEKSSLIDELASLEKARVLGLRGGDSVKEARQLLSSVALTGRFVNLEAILALFRTSNTPDETAEAKQVVEKLLSARPELRELMTRQLESEGIAGAEIGS